MKLEIKRRIKGFFIRHPSGKHIRYEADICPRPYGRLCAKLLIFDTSKNLVSFWNQTFDRDLTNNCIGVVNSLSERVVDIDKKGNESNERLRVDSRFFCIIALAMDNLTLNVIAHEAVHAAYAYRLRHSKRRYWSSIDDLEEEEIAYPAGIITHEIVRFCKSKALIQEKN